MKKYLFILIILGLATPLAAMAGNFSGPLVSCGREGQSMCTLCDLFTMVQTIIDFVSLGITVLVVVFITFGGFMILLAGANPGNLETGKKIITNAVIGVIIALLAWTVINMVFNTFVGKSDAFPAPWNKIECVGGGVVPDKNKICTCGENKMVGNKEYASGTECFSGCTNYCKTTFKSVIGGDYGCCSTEVQKNGCFASPLPGKWCERSAPSSSNVWILSGISSKQKGDANTSLVNFINCMYTEVIRVYGSTNNLTITSISDDKLCDGTCNPTTGVGCSHTKNSCHYGGTKCSGGSSAVDFRANPTTCKWLAQTARFCGGSNAWINWENDHLHISLNRATCGCNESETPNPCP